MRAEIYSVLMVALWAATPGFSYRNESPPNPDLEAIKTSTTVFATELLKQTSSLSRNKNIIMSPLSVSTVLAMVQQGARENSARQLETVLNLKPEDAKNGYRALMTQHRTRKMRAVLKLANTIYLNQNFDLLPEFRQSMSENFLASVDKADFNRPAVAAQKINDWVSNATQGRIENIVKPGAITGRTEAMIFNAIYFKAAWYYPFFKDKTTKAEFYRDGEQRSPVLVDMMSLDQDLRAGVDKKNIKATWVELPYEFYEFSMIVLLPEDNADALIQRLRPESLNYLLTAPVTREVKLKMPKFKIDASMSLVPVLQAMGVQDIFSQNSNLEGISQTKRPLMVSDVLHKATLEVDEKGSEAAAASGIVVNTLSLTPDYEDLEITVNKPFVTILVDKQSLVPIFMAKVYDPTRT